jgi:membrane-associated phospholipid phosphatase
MTNLTDAPRSAPATTMVAALVSSFIGLGVVAHHAVAGTALDHAVLGWMVAHRHPGLTSWAIAVTTVGSPAGVAVLAVIAAAVAWWRVGSARPAMVILAALAGAGAVSSLTKVIVAAHRPAAAVQLVTETDPSYPSGHVTGTLALLSAVAVVIGHHSGREVSTTVFVLAAAAAVAVACTRLYLGVHWVTDVVGGLLLGSLAGVLAYLVYRRMMGPSNVGGRPHAPTEAGPATIVPR